MTATVLPGLLRFGLATVLAAAALSTTGQDRERIAPPAARGGDVAGDLEQAARGESEADRWGRELQRPAAGGRPLDEAFIRRCLEVAREIDPAMADGLAAIRDRDPREFERRLRQSRRLVHLAELKETEPTLYELKLLELKVDTEVRRLSAEARQACLDGDDERMSELERELLTWIRLQEGFALKARQDYLDRLREHVDRLQLELDEAKVTFDERVAARVRVLLTPPAPAADGEPGG